MISVNVKSVHFSAREQLKTFVLDNVEKLNTFWDQINNAEVTLAFDKKDVRGKIAEIKISIPNKPIHTAKASGTSFQMATMRAVEKLKRQIEKSKGKLHAH